MGGRKGRRASSRQKRKLSTQYGELYQSAIRFGNVEQSARAARKLGIPWDRVRKDLARARRKQT